MPDGEGVIKGFIDKLFERVKSLSRLAMCCILVYVIAHANNLLPEGWSQYLAIPQEAIPWINLVGIIGISWVIVELLAEWKGKICMRLKEWREEREQEAAAQEEREKQALANRELEEIVNDSNHVLRKTLLLFLQGQRVVELDAMQPEVVALIKKNIIAAIDEGYLTYSNVHRCNYTLTPWVTEHVAERVLEAKMKLVREGRMHGATDTRFV